LQFTDVAGGKDDILRSSMMRKALKSLIGLWAAPLER
jgi:hypothetical protein